MKTLPLIALTCAAILLGGCESEPHRRVEWYLAHPDEAKAKAKACSEVAEAEAAVDGNCARAREAVGRDRPAGPQKLRSVVTR